jgi:ABC-type anion transport system duplicated permease subunit
MIQLPGSFHYSRQTLAQSHALKRTWPVVLDLLVALILLACFYGVVAIGRYWFSTAQPEIAISQSPRALPLYAFYSIVRIGLAYLLSLVFAVGYGYLAANSKRLEPLMIALLDILQSIPVLSFLPGVMLAMVALIPTRQLGVEMGAILLIFTGQVWNMAFSFYSSIRSIPRELREAADINRFSRLQRLIQLELPYAAIGLIWNSIMSVAGGWFFLMACEMFVLGPRDFRLPGLGSYLQTAASRPGPTGNAASRPSLWTGILVLALLGLTVFAATRALLLLKEVHAPQLVLLLEGAAATFFRVNLSLLLAAAWTIPVGVAIGFHPRLARLAQPLAQIAASVPATALFPVLLIALIKLGGGMGVGSIALMLLGTQWYILFNVIAGAMAIPSDLREVATLFRFPQIQRWRTVILPGIFPFLITGLVTASGGAWNASIIAEYFRLNNRTMQTLGLGAQISAASDSGQFQILLLATILMATMVVTVNRLVWRPLYRLAETRYRLEG